VDLAAHHVVAVPVVDPANGQARIGVDARDRFGEDVRAVA